MLRVALHWSSLQNVELEEGGTGVHDAHRSNETENLYPEKLSLIGPDELVYSPWCLNAC